jgi:4'-phosphopantetheinyl transferase
VTSTIDVTWFHVEPSDPPDHLVQLLTDDERRRADRLLVDRPRRVFAAARVALRILLARELGTTAESLRFTEGPHGKPALTPDAGLGFNLSHSGTTVAIALARNTELGVDVEELRSGVRTVNLARRFFDPQENRIVEGLPEGAVRDRAFFHFWTAKEAVLKATGSGLSVPVRTVVISPDPDDAPRVLRVGDDPHEADAWTLWRIEEPGEFLATVAARRAADRRLRVRRFSFPRSNPA